MGKLGYSTLTLTDLTETLPISLVLESNLSQNVQTKIGQLYTPDLSKEGEELIITPSLFAGAKEIKEIPIKENDEQDSNYIYYQTGEIGENGTEINYMDLSTKETGIWVDDKGRLHYKRNLNQNITIKAYIDNFKNKEYSYAIELIKAINPINILFLEEGDNNYNVVITSSDGREHFEEENAEPIELTATLYRGVTPIIDEVEYSWDVITDSDDDPLKDWTKNTQSVTIERALVKSVEVFNCTIKNKITGLSYFSTKILRDFTDAYTNQLIADNTLILTPNNTSVRITNQVWYKTSIINNEENQNRFKYEWSVLKVNGEQFFLTEEKNKTLEINIEDGNFPKENFSILGKVIIDEKAVTVNYIDIKYQPVTYTVEISPKTIFVPATNEGKYRGEGNFIQKIKFQLLDDNKQPLIYDINDSGPTSLTNNNDSSYIEINREDSSIWDFDISFILDTDASTDLWQSMNSKTYEFSYEYLGQTFSEEFEVVKNYAGIDGNPGEPGYTIDLSNNFHAFSGGEGRADLGQEVELKFLAYFGDKELEITKISLEDNEDIKDEGKEVREGLYIRRKNTVDDPLGERTYILYTASSGDNFLTENGIINFDITVKDNSIERTFRKSFQYIINFNGKSYYLQLSENTIIYKADTKYSPKQLTITAYYRETNGNSKPYENGKIRYTIDGTNWESGVGLVDLVMPDNLFIDNVNIELYSAQDTSWNKEYLLDRETIPILVSLEGTQIGGENLIPWSKTFSTDNDRWAYSPETDSNIKIEAEEDFNIINFSEAIENAGLFSPKMTLEQNYINKTFCFSCLIFCENWNELNLDSFLVVEMGAYSNDNLSRTRDRFGKIGEIGKNFNAFTFEGEGRKNGVWQKIYKTFILNEDFFTSSEIANPASISECVQMDILFKLIKGPSNIKIKKPKLEIGNISTEWSLNYQDNEILLSEIERELNTTKEELQDKIVSLSDSKISIGSEASIKLPIIEEIFSETTTESTTTVTPITITKADNSTYTFLNLKEFKTYLEELNKKNAAQTKTYSSSLITSELAEYKSTISIHPATIDDPEGYISINASTYTNETKAYLEAIKITSNKLSFRINNQETAYISNNKLFIPNGQITDSLIIGRDRETNQSEQNSIDSHLKIFATEDSGIGFIWEEITVN